jgi:hypothetical protein
MIITRESCDSARAISTRCFQAPQDLAGPAAHARPVHQADARADQVPCEDVLGHRELVEHHRLLVDGGDPVAPRVLRAVKLDRLAVDQDPSGVRPVDTGHDLHGGRLAGAVFSDQRHDLTGGQLQLYPVERPDAVEMHLDALEGEDRSLGRRAGRHGGFYRRLP